MFSLKKMRGVPIHHPFGELDLPEKLDEARLQELCEKIKTGSLSAKELDELVRGHMRLAMQIASTYAARAYHKADVFVSEAMFGIMYAIHKAPGKLKDNGLTPYIVSCVHRFCFQALTNDQVVRVPLSTRWDRKQSNLETFIPKIQWLDPSIPKSSLQSLAELKDMVDSCVKNQFEQVVITLRSLGYNDAEIAEQLKCSVTSVRQSKLNVKERFEKLERELG